MPDELRDLFRRDLGRIDLPPSAEWVPVRRRAGREWQPFLAVPAAAGVIVLALLAAFVIQLVRGDLPPQVAGSPSPSITAAGSPSASPAASPTTTPSPSRSATPDPTSVLPSSSVVHVTKTLPSGGQWALILRRGHDRVPNAQGQLVQSAVARDEILAIPLAPASQEGQAVPVLDYVGDIEGAPRGADNLLREQLSPDGRRLVLSVFDGESRDSRLALVIVDLVSGDVRALTTDSATNDVQPAWSPAGDRIAFVRLAHGQSAGGSDLGIWSINADGSGLRQILAGPARLPSGFPSPESTALFGWNGDGTAIGYGRGFEDTRYNLVDAATGRVTQIGTLSASRRPMADWRGDSPAFVGAFMAGPHGGRQYLVTAALDGSAARAALDSGTDDLSTFFGQPRWRPGSDDILYVRSTADDAARGLTVTMLVTDASGRTPRVVAEKRSTFSPTCGCTGSTYAAWTPDGREIAWVYGLGAVGELHLVAPDGSNDRVIQAFGGAPESDARWLDLAVLRL